MLPPAARKEVSNIALAFGAAGGVALLSLISISPYSGNFHISVGAMLLPVLAFVLQGFPLLASTLLAGAGVLLVRLSTFWGGGATLGAALQAAWPEMIFYWLYGGLLALLWRRVPPHPLRIAALAPLVPIDFAANMAELALRGQGLTAVQLWPLGVAALCRTLLVCGVLWVLQYYSLTIMRQQDAARYRKLLLMASMLDSELLWLQKSADMIETVTLKAYGLYDALSKADATSPYAGQSLSIATDIHEVKKEYLLITRGIGEALQQATQKDGMWFSEICDTLRAALPGTGSETSLTIAIERNFYTRHHYALLSILHNLLSNAQEAAEGGPVHVRLCQNEVGGTFILIVEDSSGGIAESVLEDIFLPGFSSKMDGQTGVIARGIGLCLVKKLVEEQFSGTVLVENWGDGARFTLTMPVYSLEEQA